MEDDNKKRRTMSVPEMYRLLGICKSEGSWLIHKNCFDTMMIGGNRRVDIESFEKWYANQVKHKKVTGEPPGMELREKSYSFQEAANLIGEYSAVLYDIWKKEDRKCIVVDYVRRIPKEEFDIWLESQDVYRKADKMPTLEDMENDYIRLKDAAAILNLNGRRIINQIKRHYPDSKSEMREFDERRWISKRSFQWLLNSRNGYVSEQLDCSDDVPEMKLSRYISTKEAADLAGVSCLTVTKWIRAGMFPAKFVGRLWKIPRMEYIAWLEKSRKGDC